MKARTSHEGVGGQHHARTPLTPQWRCLHTASAIQAVHGCAMENRQPNVHFATSEDKQENWVNIKKPTPFGQTPASRLLRSTNKPRLHPDDLPRLQSLLKKWLHVSRVSPLFGFSPTCLKKYSQMLSAHLQAEQRKGVPVEMGEHHTGHALLSIFPGLAVTGKESEAVCIQVFKKESKTKQKIVWEGVLCCTDADVSLLASIPAEFTCLPLMLWYGPKGVGMQVAGWLQKTFDCRVGTLTLTSQDLAWMVTLWIMNESKATNCTELKWTAPTEVKEGLTISMSIHPTDALQLWECIHMGGNEVTMQEVSNFMNGIESHFYNHFHIILSAMSLAYIGTSAACAARKGKIKMLTVGRMHEVLRFLTELAVPHGQ
ncbi:centromere protein L isoform X2 [Lampetra planeri]